MMPASDQAFWHAATTSGGVLRAIVPGEG